MKKVIVCDTRQKREKHEFKHNQMISAGYDLLRSKLPIGDYSFLHCMSTIVDTKQDMNEVYSNIISDHERFINELKLAKETGIKLIILIEHGDGINSVEDVANWKNPRAFRWNTENGKRKMVKTKCVPSPQLAKAMKTIQERYGCEFHFCEKDETGNRIIEILESGK